MCRPTPFESMLYTNLAGAIVALGFAVVTGQMQDGLAFCRASSEFVQALVAFSLCSALGQCFIYYTVTEFSPLLLATVTTTRKIFSTVYSVFRHPGASPPRLCGAPQRQRLRRSRCGVPGAGQPAATESLTAAVLFVRRQ
jgi:hypothetical protein